MKHYNFNQNSASAFFVLGVVTVTLYLLPVVVVVSEKERLASALVVQCSTDLLHLSWEPHAAEGLRKPLHNVITEQRPDLLT